ncbi:flagellar basal body-associated FliL family protein [uncultured Tateyamaria sp.]|uniref:flagellar basal body-associated FliL family protein n=1 Tax=uncultured Tateyamaria sp. TaxID=455651 RepID=UPI0026029FB6|nr:flagellar basal body-associated FliL family protein [uncultured Tateyamaria sp.]
MTDAAAEAPPEAKKSSKLPLIFGMVAALLGGGGGFYATFSGLILAPETAEHNTEAETQPGAMPDIAFVEVEPMTISISPASQGRHLRFRAQLEVPSQHAADVRSLLPRVVDVMNGYLRAVEVRDIESAAALTRLRAQLLRRVQIVAGPDRVNDLLIMEFVLN